MDAVRREKLIVRETSGIILLLPSIYPINRPVNQV